MRRHVKRQPADGPAAADEISEPEKKTGESEKRSSATKRAKLVKGNNSFDNWPRARSSESTNKSVAVGRSSAQRAALRPVLRPI